LYAYASDDISVEYVNVFHLHTNWRVSPLGEESSFTSQLSGKDRNAPVKWNEDSLVRRLIPCVTEAVLLVDAACNYVVFVLRIPLRTNDELLELNVFHKIALSRGSMLNEIILKNFRPQPPPSVDRPIFTAHRNMLALQAP